MNRLISLFIITTLLSYNVYVEGKQFYSQRIKNGKTEPKLYDIGFKYIPNLSENKILSFFNNFIPILLVLILLKGPLMLIFSNIFLHITLLRAVFINLTILPKDKSCNDNNSMNIIFGHCYDKIFSGHFSSMILLSLILYKYSVYTNVAILTSSLVLYGIFIIAIRAHYTVDLGVSVLATYTVFNLIDN